MDRLGESNKQARGEGGIQSTYQLPEASDKRSQRGTMVTDKLDMVADNCGSGSPDELGPSLLSLFGQRFYWCGSLLSEATIDAMISGLTLSGAPEGRVGW